MARLPDSVYLWIGAEAEPGSERPYANHLTELAARGCNSSRKGVCVVRNQNRAGRKSRRQQSAQVQPLELLEIRRLLDHAIANNAARPTANHTNLRASANLLALAAHDIAVGFGRHLRPRIRPAFLFRISPHRSHHAVP